MVPGPSIHGMMSLAQTRTEVMNGTFHPFIDVPD
jgi:hypothetical protein